MALLMAVKVIHDAQASAWGQYPGLWGLETQMHHQQPSGRLRTGVCAGHTVSLFPSNPLSSETDRLAVIHSPWVLPSVLASEDSRTIFSNGGARDWPGNIPKLEDLVWCLSRRRYKGGGNSDKK